jgi:integrase
MGVRVREKKPGEWWIFVHHGKRRISRKVGDRKAAIEAAKQIKAKLVLGDMNLDKAEVPCFKEYAEQWLGTYVKQIRREATYRRYRELLVQYGYPKIGSLPLDKITRAHVRDILLELHSRGLSRSTISLMKDALSGPLSYAIDEGLITVNPTAGVLKALHIERDKREHLDPFNKQEVEAFLKACLELYPEHYPFFLTAFRTGMRLGELLALQWGDIDWHGRFIQVSRSYKLGRITATKTGRSRRVDMSDGLVTALQAHLRLCKEQGFKLGLGDAPEFVFHREGAPLEQNYIRRIFKRVLAKAGLREIRIHDIRHTYASLLLSEGVSPVYVKEQLGHSSIQMTVDIYGHWIPNAERRAVSALDSLSGVQESPETTPLQPHPNAPQAHPEKNKGLQPIEITALS